MGARDPLTPELHVARGYQSVIQARVGVRTLWSGGEGLYPRRGHNPPLHTVGKQGGPNAHVRNTGAIRGCVPYINTSGSLARPTTYEPQFTRNRNTVLEGEPLPSTTHMHTPWVTTPNQVSHSNGGDVHKMPLQAHPTGSATHITSITASPTSWRDLAASHITRQCAPHQSLTRSRTHTCLTS